VIFEDPQATTFNYFNYFTEVEDEFVRRRGKPLFISPLDWALVETWKNAGIPLHIVLRSINQTFDGYDKRPHAHQKINSILYCQQAVESNFADYRIAQVGAGAKETDPGSESEADSSSSPAQGDSAFSRSDLLEFIGRCDRELLTALEARQPGLEDVLTRSRARLAEITRELEGATRVDAEALERDLDSLDRILVEGALNLLGEQGIAELRKEAKSELRSYKKKMDKAIYEQTVENFIARRLRQMNHIPRMSLFYM
jgi:hypothetical protein